MAMGELGGAGDEEYVKLSVPPIPPYPIDKAQGQSAGERLGDLADWFGLLELLLWLVVAASKETGQASRILIHCGE